MRIKIVAFLLQFGFCVILGTSEQHMLEQIKSYFSMPDPVFADLYERASTCDLSNKKYTACDNCSLFNFFPQLREKISYISFANLPTPIVPLKEFGFSIGCEKLFMKRDDLTGRCNNDGRREFGGNKVRKLEFVLADALKSDFETVITFGCAGSNHACATAWHAPKLGLVVHLMLKPQHNSHVVRRNLLLDYNTQATLHFSLNNEVRLQDTINILKDSKNNKGKFPYIIPTGASYPIGVLGYINAACELKEQIDSGIIPLPDRIYLPVGSAGTIVGLLIGTKLLDLKTKLIGITTEPEDSEGEFVTKINTLFRETNEFLRSIDNSWPTLELSENDFELVYDHAGTDYALFTAEAVEAMQMLRKTENIQGDGIYSGKAIAGMISDLNKHPEFKNQVILFWYTFCEHSFSEITNDIDYHKMPQEFHCYFETEVQELDQL